MNDCCYGDYAEGEFSPSGQANPCKNKLFPVPAGHGKYSDVLILYPYPGMKYPDIKEYKAVILCTYHSGTICTASEKLKEFMQMLSGIIFLCIWWETVTERITKAAGCMTDWE